MPSTLGKGDASARRSSLGKSSQNVSFGGPGKESSKLEENDIKVSGTMSKPFDKNIFGDVFGVNERMNSNSILGMMYNSRLQREDIESLRRLGEGGTPQDSAREKDRGLKDTEESTSVFEDGSDDEPEVLESLNSRQQLALTIRNWSVIDKNDAHLIQEGAVHALIGLAGLDDNFIKKCCATALNNLASRKDNRGQLLKLGAATGVIQIAMSVRDWKIAKLCAQTLCSLSMHQHGEAVMAKDGAILALVILLGVRGYRLLPIASQSLYNLTCVDNHYKGIERTIKAFLSLPVTQVDTSEWLLKSVVNCCRYSWIRMRIIEDGVLAGISTLVTSMAGRHNKHILIPLVATAIRQVRIFRVVME